MSKKRKSKKYPQRGHHSPGAHPNDGSNPDKRSPDTGSEQSVPWNGFESPEFSETHELCDSAPVRSSAVRRRRSSFTILVLGGGFLTVFILLLIFAPGLRFARMRDALGFVIRGGVFASTGPFPSFRTEPVTEGVEYADFVGSEACLRCHIEQYTLWRNSTHGRAGGDPGDVKIVARFDDQPLIFKDAVVVPTRGDEGEYIFRVRIHGRPEMIVSVDAVVGGGHMEGGGTQSFFTRLPDGTLRLIPFDFNRTENVWFVQHADLRWLRIDETLSIHTLANWPPNRILGTWDSFSHCQNCHGSQILVDYDPRTKKYTTKYMTLQINCESCHGPGSEHIERMESADLDTLTDIGIVVLSTVDKDESLRKCFECHAVKATLTNAFLSGMPLESHYALKFPVISTKPYQHDGRVREFAYQQNHLFSDCYVNGSMTCVDCHDPHSTGYRDIFFKPLYGKFHDGQCTDCHPSKADDPTHHSYHKSDSPGNVCTACHMPFLQHPLLGPSVRFARSDHVIPIPRPEFDANLGIENACEQCHRDRSVEWQQEWTDRWYRSLKPHNSLLRNNMAADRFHSIEQAAERLLNPEAVYPMAQLTGLFEFVQRFLKPDIKGIQPAIIDRLMALTEHADLDTRSLAMMALHLIGENDPEIQSYLIDRLRSSGKDETGLRLRWAFAMDFMGMDYGSRRDYQSAIRAHQKALQIRPDDAYTLVNLGLAYELSGDSEKAIQTFRKAIRVQPERPTAYFQLASLYIRLNRTKDAIRELKAGLRIDPSDLQARQMLRRLE